MTDTTSDCEGNDLRYLTQPCLQPATHRVIWHGSSKSSKSYKFCIAHTAGLVALGTMVGRVEATPLVDDATEDRGA